MSKQMLELAEELREYTAMKYAGDCKCGKCQLVPRRLVERIYHALNSTAIRLSAVSVTDVRDGIAAIISDHTMISDEGFVQNPDRVAGLILEAFPTLNTEPQASAGSAEIGILREKLGNALAGGLSHTSDCAVHNAPAYEPGPCNCGAVASVDEPAVWSLIFSDHYGINDKTTYKTKALADAYASGCGAPKPRVVPLYTRPAPSASVREALLRSKCTSPDGTYVHCPVEQVVTAVAVSVGCGDPNCSDPNCEYGNGPVRCQSCGAIGTDPTNHHNALKCPYCNPRGLKFAEPAPASDRDADLPTANDVRGILGPAPVNLPQDIDAATGTADDQGLFALGVVPQTASVQSWVKILADNWRGRNGNSMTGDSVRNSCADELEKVAARHSQAESAALTQSERKS